MSNEGKGKRGRKDGNSSSENISTNNQRTIEGTDTNGIGEGNERSQEIIAKPIVVDVEIPTSEDGTEQVPKIKKQYKKKKESKSNVEDISSLIEGLFGVCSFAIGNEWQITKVEADRIANPLSNILERYNLLERMAGASDGLLLVTALTMTIAPRVIITRQKRIESRVKKDVVLERVVADNESRKAESNKGRKVSKDSESNNDGNLPISPNGSFIKSVSQPIY